MKMNRRNVLAGLGGLAVGGGALLGSGAFSSVEATRDVTVEVTEDIANIEEAPDVLLNAGAYDEIAVNNGSLVTNAATLSPQTDITPPSANLGTDSDEPYGENYVSLLENDVRIIFGYNSGTDNRLPPNSTVTFEDALVLVQEDTSNDSDSTWVQFGEGSFSNASVSMPNGPQDVTVPQNSATESSSGNAAVYDIEVETPSSGSETSTGELLISVGSDPSA